MKATETFKKTLKEYLDKRAGADSLFAEKYTSENKNIDDCITYILNTVQKSGCNGLTDEEVYGMAVHYYDEESIDVGKEITAQVIVNHTVELTLAEKQEARQKAIDKYQEDIYRSIAKKTEKKVDKQPEVIQASLF